MEKNLALDLARKNFNYSTKNIPVHGKDLYIKTLISKSETFVKNIRWRAFFYLNPDLRMDHKETYGFISTKPPPIIPELKEFENDLVDLIQNIKFRHVPNHFQNKLRKDINLIKKDDHLYIPADKTNNYYRVKPADYEQLLEKSVRKNYKKTDRAAINDIIKTDIHIAKNLDLADRINTTAERESFITLKDHKENFKNKPTCRLINPCKPEIGKISKQLLEKIVKVVKDKTKYNHWKNTQDVITWFEGIPNKKSNTFIAFDICDFYPSITEELLDKALDFASHYIEITNDEREIIKHAKKTTLYSNNMPWRKIRSDFDVTMGSFDGAETCELVGLFLLSQLTHLDVNVGLYRDDGLATCTKTPKQVEAIKKEMCKIFKRNSLQITIEANKKVVDFLDITLDLRAEIYKPYKKPNSNLTYIHKQSNHPPSIIKNLPKSINKRLSTNSKNAQIFNEACPAYTEALKKNGYNTNLQFDKTCTNRSSEKNKTRKRNITWFNPPFKMNVATNVAKTFLSLIDKHFPKNKKLSKIFNRNTIKVSYSCLPNVKQTISNNNHRLLQLNRMKESTQDSKLCNCRQKSSCPLDGKCLTKCVVYKATVTETTSKNQETYIGLTENEFKTRFNLHKSSFKLEHKRTSTTLSDHVWKLKKEKHQLQYFMAGGKKSKAIRTK